MPHRHLTFISLFTVIFLTAGCSPDFTGVNFGAGLGSGCCQWPAAPGMDPGTDQRMLVGDTIEIFSNAGTTAATWKYDSTVFAPTQPADFVRHHGSTVSHIALRALTTGISSITANPGASERRVTVETILPSMIGGLSVNTLPCQHMSVTVFLCATTWFHPDTASLQTGDTMRVVSSAWTKEGGLVNANPRWTSSNPNIVTVSQVFSDYYTAWLPVVIARGPGVSTISATVAGYSGSMDVTVVR